jgi:KDO2-lipid IV(A) lauroyltransferase
VVRRDRPATRLFRGGAVEEKALEERNFFLKLLENGLLGVFYLTRLLSLFLPPRAVDRIIDFLGSLGYYVRPGMRRHLVKKVEQALPETERDGTSRLIARKACSAALRPILDLVLFARHGEELMRNLRVEGMENLEEAEARGKGVLLLFAHIGSFDIFSALLARLGKPFTPVMFHPQDTPVPRYISTLAVYGQRLGCDREYPVFWAGRDTARKVLESLSRGRRVGITFDVDGRTVVELFGRPAAMADGLARFALASGAPIVPIALYHDEDVLKRRLVIHPPLPFLPSGDTEKDVQDLTQQVVSMGERMIREAPEQWMSWFGLWHWWNKARELKERGESSIAK